MKVHQVFTPNDTPTVTYVDRKEYKHEENLRNFWSTPNMVVSISGPSKSGKTVLIKKVIPEELLIPVMGVGISEPSQLWQRVLNWMEIPSDKVTTSHSSSTLSGEMSGSGGLSVLVAGAKASASAGVSSNSGNSTTIRHKEDVFVKVVREIAGSDFTIFIDDFHYIAKDIREEIGRQIKVAAENGVKIITASVPHRSDDVVRSNPELRGRVVSVDLKYWDSSELEEIARLGFGELNCDIPPSVISLFARESFGSPQLMQSLCLNLCYKKSINDELDHRNIHQVDNRELNDVLLMTSQFTDFSKMLTSLHTGPRTRGTERKEHAFIDGSAGDVYRAILIAMKQDPPMLSIPYDAMLERVRSVCTGSFPVGSSIVSALEQMDSIAEDIQPGTSPLSWDGTTLDFNDPYLLFFLRCSEKLKGLVRG